MKVRYIALIAVLAVAAYAGWFYYKNLRGAKPAFGKPATSPTATTSVSTPSGKSVNATGLPLSIPDGTTVSVFARNLSGPRVIARAPDGTILVSIPSQGRVVALPDADADGTADIVVPVVTGLNRPHGLAFRGNTLYIAETDGVSAYEYDSDLKKASGRTHILDLPGGGNHFSRTIGFGPDGKLYISVGSSCNACNEKDWRRAKILVAEPDGSGLREYATGLRNSVFFLWHPQTREMWATDMGRDLLGDDVPREEVNIVKDHGFYGWPNCYQDKQVDRSFDGSAEAAKRCETSVAPHIMFQAHSAPLGLAFIPDSWPERYRGDLLVAYHGSWNRSKPTGYKIVRFDLNERLVPVGESDFISGWLEGDQASGRPVDLVFDNGGALYVTDDKAGVIYRVTVSR